MSWKDIETKYYKEYPPFAGPYNDNPDFLTWLKDNYEAPIEKIKNLSEKEIGIKKGLNIIKIQELGSKKSGALRSTYHEIVNKLGEPNITELINNPKVEAAWAIKDLNSGKKAFIWCFKSNKYSTLDWFTDGDLDLLDEIFEEITNKV